MTDTQQPDRVVRLPRELVDQMQMIAKAHERSLAGELRMALKQYVSRHSRQVRESKQQGSE